MEDLRGDIAPGIIRAQWEARIGAGPLQWPPCECQGIARKEPIRRQRHDDNRNQQQKPKPRRWVAQISQRKTLECSH